MQIREFLEDWLSRKKAIGNVTRNTVLTYERLLEIASKALGGVSVKGVKRLDVERAYAKLKAEGYSPATIATINTLLSAAFEDGVVNGVLSANPTKGAQRPKLAARRRNPNIPQDSVVKLLALAQEDPRGLIVRFALGTGCRRGEMAALTWGDFDWTTQTVQISKQIVQNGSYLYTSQPKTAAGRRVIALPGTLYAELWNLAQCQSPKPTDPVFVDEAGKRLTPAAMTETVGRMLRKAGLGEFHLHDLRHTHVSRLVSSGMPIPAVAARAGHADPRTTLSVYSHPTAGEDARLAAQIDKVLQ